MKKCMYRWQKNYWNHPILKSSDTCMLISTVEIVGAEWWNDSARYAQSMKIQTQEEQIYSNNWD